MTVRTDLVAAIEAAEGLSLSEPLEKRSALPTAYIQYAGMRTFPGNSRLSHVWELVVLVGRHTTPNPWKRGETDADKIADTVLELCHSVDNAFPEIEPVRALNDFKVGDRMFSGFMVTVYEG